jgi:hypothetical protein
MKPCENHWKLMRARIEELGLSKFVAGSGEEVLNRTMRMVEALEAGKEVAPTDWDPLMAMFNGFMGRAMDIWGLTVLGKMPEDVRQSVQHFYEVPENDEHFCPLCLARVDFFKHLKGKDGHCDQPGCTVQAKEGDEPWDEQWIRTNGDFQLEDAKARGLIRVN